MRHALMLLVCGLSASVLAQQSPDKNMPTTLPPPVALGERVSKLDRTIRDVSTVVVVESAAAYLEALAGWSPARRYPVLIDDGTLAAAEDIGRFVRAYQPTSIVHWEQHGDSVAWKDVGEQSMRGVLARAWDQPAESDEKALLKAWLDRGHLPPGVVVMKGGDEAWTGGIALAAARGQAMAFVKDSLLGQGGVNGALSLEQAGALSGAIEGACQQAGLRWRELGDDVDAVTLAMHVPVRVERIVPSGPNKGEKEFVALSDFVGRHGGGESRWAWSGHVFGTAANSAYRAMCSIFTRPEGAWLFDGYENKAPWNAYDCTKASVTLRQQGLSIEVLDAPSNGAADWRRRATRPIEGGLVLITSSGNADFFNLSPGQCTPGDVPLLDRPAIVHIVHSWSTLFAGSRDLLAGRWQERGAYFYVGSVHEPYLSAFLPTPLLAGRMMSGAALGAAVRQDAGPVWKVAVLGDPLTTMLPTAARVEEEAGLAGATAIDAGLREHLTGGRFASAARTLVMQGRDEALVRLMNAAHAKDPGSISSEAAALTILPAARRRDDGLVLAMFRRLDEQTAKTPMLRDALWLSSYAQLQGKASAELLATLRANLRPEQLGRDATTYAAGLERAQGRAAADAALDALEAGLSTKAQRESLAAARKVPREQWLR